MKSASGYQPGTVTPSTTDFVSNDAIMPLQSQRHPVSQICSKCSALQGLGSWFNAGS